MMMGGFEGDGLIIAENTLGITFSAFPKIYSPAREFLTGLK
jgi:hypothetical protein